MKKITIIYAIFASLVLTNGQVTFSTGDFGRQLNAYGRLNRNKKQVVSRTQKSTQNKNRNTQKAQNQQKPQKKQISNQPGIQNNQQKSEPENPTINNPEEEKKGLLRRAFEFEGLNSIMINFLLNRFAKNATPENKKLVAELLSLGISFSGINSFFSEDPLVNAAGSVLFNGVQGAIIGAIFSGAMTLCGKGADYIVNTIDSKLSPTGIPHKIIETAKTASPYALSFLSLLPLVFTARNYFSS